MDAQDQKLAKLEAVMEALVNLAPRMEFEEDEGNLSSEVSDLWGEVLLRLDQAGYEVWEWAEWQSSQESRAEEAASAIVYLINYRLRWFSLLERLRGNLKVSDRTKADILEETRALVGVSVKN